MSKKVSLSSRPKPDSMTDKEVLAILEPPFTDKDQGRPGRPTKHPRNDIKFNRMNIFIPPDLHRRLRVHAVTIGESMNDIIIDQIERYMEGKL